jgi:CheY-like chemotaxis protein
LRTPLCLILEAVGYSAAVAYSGEQALQTAAIQPRDPLISDVIMPGIRGFELGAIVRQEMARLRRVTDFRPRGLHRPHDVTPARGTSFELLDNLLRLSQAVIAGVSRV